MSGNASSIRWAIENSLNRRVVATPSCRTCPLLRLPRHCEAQGEQVIDPDRVVCWRHPHAPRQVAGQVVTFVWSGARLHWFFVLLDPTLDSCNHDWGIEDVRGVPLVVSTGRHRCGSRFFRIDLPGGLELACGDAIGLASETRAWREAHEDLGEAELQRRLHVMELFTCFTLCLEPSDDMWDGSRAPTGWPSVEVGCPCGRLSRARRSP